jgi:hypothetical protein
MVCSFFEESLLPGLKLVFGERAAVPQPGYFVRERAEVRLGLGLGLGVGVLFPPPVRGAERGPQGGRDTACSSRTRASSPVPQLVVTW